MVTTINTFNAGERVQVKQFARAPKEDRQVLGRFGTFIEYTQPRGFARVALDPLPDYRDQSPTRWLVHPENLVRAK